MQLARPSDISHLLLPYLKLDFAKLAGLPDRELVHLRALAGQAGFPLEQFDLGVTEARDGRDPNANSQFGRVGP